MRIRSLEHFIALAQAGSFYQAARQHDLSVQGFAKMLSALERELGVELATRGKSGIRLTRAGEVLLEEALSITERWDRTKARLDAYKDVRRKNADHIKVFTTHYGMQAISRLRYIQEALSDCDLYEESFDRILVRAHRANPNEVFIADVFSDAAHADMKRRGIIFEPFYESVLGLIVRKDCPLVQLETVSVSDIGMLKMSNYLHKEWNHHVEKALEGQISESVFFESTALNLLVDFVKSAPDHGILSDSFSAYSMRKNPVYDLTDLRFVPLKDAATHPFLGVLYHRDQELTSRIPLIVAAWRESAQSNSADYFDEFARL